MISKYKAELLENLSAPFERGASAGQQDQDTEYCMRSLVS